MNNSQTLERLGKVAIVGMAGRFPGAKNIEQFWWNMSNGVESVKYFSEEELISANIDPTFLSDPNYVKAGSVLEDIELFDAGFFGFNPREAEITDPQHRLFLETAWEALENVGYTSENYPGRIGVYAGSSVNGYFLFNLFSNDELIKTVGFDQIRYSNRPDNLTTKVTYKLNLTGPGVTVQTNCSTSLVAVHMACQSLLCGECDMALAGGVTVLVPHKVGYLYQKGSILSPDGHCRTFDAKAQGTIVGSGVGIVVLKRLEDALVDGDTIHAVILGSAINNDGAQKVGYTAPSIDGQAAAIAEAQAIAEVEPDTIAYVEAHGTATALGDPIEIAALTQAFRNQTSKKGFCAIGSVKTNVGHLDAAAGVTGLIKTVLALKHKQIPPSLHFQKPNSEIDFANSPFYVNTTLSQWKTNGTPRRAGVSSFGIGGTNAHVILEEAPDVETATASLYCRPWQLLVLSAKTSSALETATANLASYLKQNPHLNLADVVYTLQVGRRAFDYRGIVVCQSIEDAVTALESSDPQQVLTQFQESCNRPIVFMFPGQGAQYANMGRELYQTEPIFKEQIDNCAHLLKPHLELDLRDILYPTDAQTTAATEQLKQTSITQPALFVIEYALAQLWMAWGMRPHSMIGHSVGEYVAACLAGVFSLKDALALVAIRGQLMQQLPPSAMLSVSLPEPEIQPFLRENLSIGAINGPSTCVVSGSAEAVDELHNRLTEQGISCRKLHTSHAFHSPMMNPILEEFTAQVKKVSLHPPQIPFISNVTGTWITAAQATDPSYWAKHLRQTVRFSRGIGELLKQPNSLLLEVGPGRTLSTFAKQHKANNAVVLSTLRHPQEQQSDVEFLLKTLGKLWLAGIQVNWSGFYANEQRQRIPLPTYPFERQRYWIEPPKLGQDKTHLNHPSSLHKKSDIAEWFYIPSWKQSRPLEPLTAQKSCWLIFVDECGVGLQLAKRLEQAGQDVITVVVGEQFSKLSDRSYAIHPQQPFDYDALIKELQVLVKPKAIAHLWSLTPNQQAQSSIQFFEQCQDLGFYSLLFLTQALGKEITDECQILVVTNNVHDIIGAEQLCPEKATVLGMCKVIPQEYPFITCRSVDVTIPETKISQENLLIDQLVAELTGNSPELVVSYRGKHRWLQTFEPVRLEKTRTEKTQLRQGGVYLITGGLGGIGFVLAEYLAQTVQAKLILICRSSFPEKTEWEQWLSTHDQQDSVSRKILKVQTLEKLGAEVLVISADVGNEEQMQGAIALASERFGELHGVIHAAGVRLVSTVQQITRTECEKQFQPKVQGLYVLEKVLQGKNLDFCILLSSLASVLGLLGLAAYPAAHIFLDTFAYKHNQTNSRRWMSVNWDNWSSEKTQIPEWFMTPEEGVKAFQRILSMGAATQVIVSTGDLKARLDQWTQLKSQQDIKRSEKDNLLSSHSRPNLPNTYIAPRNEVEQTLTEIWQQLLGIQPVGIHDNFFELGGDSVLGIQFITRANKAGLQLTTKQVFEHQTIAELSTVVSTNRIKVAEQGLVTGSVPLTPIQHWFFEQNQPDPHHWNQSVLLEVLQPLNPTLLHQAVQHLLVHHDALRLRFVPTESGWQQINASPNENVPFTYLDLSARSQDEQNSAIEETATELQASLYLSSGPLMRVALFNKGFQSSRLLIIIHHLVVDVVSWRILLEDLQTAYQQLSQGQTIQLPPKTTSFQQWAERLQNYACSTDFQREMNDWLTKEPHGASRLPMDYPQGANTVEAAKTVSAKLSIEETQALVQEIPKVYRTQIEETLLTALLYAFTKWTGTPLLLVDLEGNGREALFEGVDLSRTIGWFTTIAPVLLTLTEADNPEDALKGVKEQLRRIPKEGIGYGTLLYLSSDEAIVQKLRAFAQAEVIFLYLGQLDRSSSQTSLFKLTGEFSGPERSPRGHRRHLLQITALIAEGQLQLNWTYSENVHRRSTIEGLSRSFIEALRFLIAHCQSADTSAYTPSDFSAAKISQKDLNKLLAQHSRRS